MAYGYNMPQVMVVSFINIVKENLYIKGLDTGEPPSDHQMWLEVTNILRRLSTAAVRAASTVLLARVSQIGQGSGWLAGGGSGRGGRSGRWSTPERPTS